MDELHACIVYFTCARCWQDTARPITLGRDGAADRLPRLCERCDTDERDRIARQILATVWNEREA